MQLVGLGWTTRELEVQDSNTDRHSDDAHVGPLSALAACDRVLSAVVATLSNTKKCVHLWDLSQERVVRVVELCSAARASALLLGSAVGGNDILAVGQNDGCVDVF